MKMKRLLLIVISVCILGLLQGNASVFAREENKTFDYDLDSIYSMSENEVVESLINLRDKYEITYDLEEEHYHDETISKIRVLNDYITIKAIQGVPSACRDCELHNEKGNRSGIFHVSPNCTCNWVNYLMDEPCANCQYYVSVMDGVCLIIAGFNVRGWDLAADLLSHNMSNSSYDSDYYPSSTLTAQITQAPQISEICNNNNISGECIQDTPGRLNGVFASTIEGDVFNSLGKFNYIKSYNGSGTISFKILDRYDWHTSGDCPGGILINNMVAAEELGIVTPFYTCIEMITGGNSPFSWDYYNDGVMIDGYYGASNNVLFPSGILDFRYHQTQLQTVDVNRISSWAFEDCTSITTIAIPSSVTYIGNYAFYGCSNLSLVEEERAQAELATLGPNSFYGCSSSLQIKVPNDRIADYKNMTNWSTYSNKIIPYTNDFTTINMSSSTNTTQTLTLDAGYNKLYKLNVVDQGTYDVRASTSTNTTIKLYDSNYTLLETKSKLLTKTLSTGIYYVSIAYQSNTQSGTLYPLFKVHSGHSYDYSYQWTSLTNHRSYCGCGNYIDDFHVVSPDAYQNGNQYAICLLCNGFASFGGTWHDGIGSFPYTLNGSFILPNGVIVLEEADMEAYLNGTLVFINPNENIDRGNNHIPCIIRREDEYILD